MTIRKIPLYWLLVGLCSLIGAALILDLTAGNIATWADSGQYFSAARTLLAGKDLLRCNGVYFVTWPPLYPVLIAGLQAAGQTNLEAARIINSVGFGLIVFAAGALFSLALRSRLLALLGTVAVLLSWPQVLWAIHALSETVFTLLIVASIVLLWLFLDRMTPRRFMWLVLVAALVPMQRYIGAAILPAGALAILLLAAAPLRRRVQCAVFFGVAASLPTALWLLRNLTLTGTLTGGRPPWSLSNLPTTIYQYIDPMLDWLVPQRIGTHATVTGSSVLDVLLLIVIAGLLLVGYQRRSQSQGESARLKFAPLLLIFFAVYTAAVQFSASLVNFAHDAPRVAAPLYPLFILFLLMGLEAAARWADGRIPRRAGTLILMVGVAAWLLLPAEKLWREFTSLRVADGWRGFTSMAIRSSPLVTWEHPEEIIDPIFSNDDDALCPNVSRFVQALPVRDAQAAEDRLMASDNDTLTVVVLNMSEQAQLQYGIEAFADRFEILPLVETEEGGIYRLTRRG